MFRAIAFAALVITAAPAQQTVDNSTAANVTPYPVVSYFPGVCRQGNHITYTGGVHPVDYVCNFDGLTWTQLGTGGSSSLPNASALGQIPATQSVGSSPTVGYPAKLTEDIANNNLLLGNSADARNATWLLMGYATNGSGSNAFGLFIYYSNDGVRYYYLNTGFDGSDNVADVTWVKINGRYWISFTQFAGSGVGLGMAYSDDLVNWTQISDILVTGTYGSCSNNCMGPYVWAPEIYQDPAEIPAAGATTAKYHFFYANGNSLGTLGAANINHVLGTYTYATQTWAFTNEAGTSNSADLLISGLHAVDPFVIKIGSTYNLVYADDQTSGSMGLQLATSSTIAGTYSVVTSGNWTGQIPETSYISEAPSLLVHGVDGSLNPIIRMYYMTVPNSGGMKYIQASLTGNLNTLTWSAPVAVTAVGASSQSNYPVGAINHGTVRIDESVETLRDLFLATAQQSSKTFGAVSGPLCVGNLIRQTASTATTATFSGTTVTGDVLHYACLAY